MHKNQKENARIRQIFSLHTHTPVIFIDSCIEVELVLEAGTPSSLHNNPQETRVCNLLQLLQQTTIMWLKNLRYAINHIRPEAFYQYPSRNFPSCI